MGYWELRGARGGDATGQVVVYVDDNNKAHYPGDEGYQLISPEAQDALNVEPSGVVHEHDFPAVVPGEPSDPSVAGAGDESQVSEEGTVVAEIPADQVSQVQMHAPELKVIRDEENE